MFDRDRLQDLFDLQRRSYALLRWISAKVQGGTLPLTDLTADAVLQAEETIRRCCGHVPVAFPKGSLRGEGGLRAGREVRSGSGVIGCGGSQALACPFGSQPSS
jgi:hypothetical protein